MSTFIEYLIETDSTILGGFMGDTFISGDNYAPGDMRNPSFLSPIVKRNGTAKVKSKVKRKKNTKKRKQNKNNL